MASSSFLRTAHLSFIFATWFWLLKEAAAVPLRPCCLIRGLFERLLYPSAAYDLFSDIEYSGLPRCGRFLRL